MGSLLSVVLPSLNVKSACCNGHVWERSKTAIVTMSACTYACMSLSCVGCWCMSAQCCPRNVVFGLQKRSLLRQRHDRAAGTPFVWVVRGTSFRGDKNCSLPLPVLVNNDLLRTSAYVGQFYLLSFVVSSVVIRHVLLSDSRSMGSSWRGSHPM